MALTDASNPSVGAGAEPPLGSGPQPPSAGAGPSGAGPEDSRGVPPAPRVRPPVRRRALLASRRRQIGAGLVVVAAIGFLLYEGLGNATEYYKTVPQAVADRTQLGHSQFRIMGTVANDVRQVGHTTEFDISWAGVSAQVVDTEEPPELFKPGIPVVLEGHWQGALFDSDLIMIKHSSNYTPPTAPPAPASRAPDAAR